MYTMFIDSAIVLCTRHCKLLYSWLFNAALDHPEIQACISACRNVVTHFNLSMKSTGELQKQTVGKPVALQQDVATNWEFYILYDEVNYCQTEQVYTVCCTIKISQNLKWQEN